MKPYKVLKPEETISRIRASLNRVNIFLKEDTYNKNDKLFTTRVSIANNGLDKLNIGTNGKGTTYLYALASGYAEFMERLQNGILFRGIKSAYKDSLRLLPNSSIYKKSIIEKNVSLDFLYDPREKECVIEKDIDKNEDFYLKMFPFLSGKNEIREFLQEVLGFDTLITVPFFSLKKNAEIYLPIEVLWYSCGSNGMASGNSKEEAIIQGFCEIFERYAGYEIYRNNLTPPNIPISEFKNHKVYNLITSLIEDNGYELIIKDCSLGLGLPVLGVMVIDKNNCRYNFNLGSALDPYVALERCLTELYQGDKRLSWYNIKFEDYSGNKKLSEEYIYINGSKLFVDSSGYWPKSLFSLESSYEYKGLVEGLNKSDKEDIEFIKNKIYSLGFTAYIRDVSFLGFNSYYIIVPGMSQFQSHKTHYSVLGETISDLHSIRNIREVSSSELIKLCKSLNKDYKFLKLINFNFNDLIVYHKNYDLLDLDIELLLFMLNYKVGNLEESFYYISEFITEKDFSAYRYYYCIKDYMSLKTKEYTDEDIAQCLGVVYSDIIDEVIEDLKDPEKILSGYEWPSCFNCERCQIKDDCCQLDFLTLYKRIQMEPLNTPITHYKNFI